jgi:diketogulonate reductase-like aldo/keto reductase
MSSSSKYLCVHLYLQDKLRAHAEAGFTTFDTADIYGPSEGEQQQQQQQQRQVALPSGHTPAALPVL